MNRAFVEDCALFLSAAIGKQRSIFSSRYVIVACVFVCAESGWSQRRIAQKDFISFESFLASSFCISAVLSAIRQNANYRLSSAFNFAAEKRAELSELAVRRL